VSIWSALNARNARNAQAGPAATRSGLRFVAGLYRVRVIGMVIGLISFAPAVLVERAPSTVLALLAAAFLAWPHVAHELSRRAAQPLRAERRNLLFDALLAGVVVALLNFRLLPAAIVMMAVAMNSIALGGVRFLIAGVLTSAVGMALGTLGFGVQVDRPDEPYATLFMLPMMLIYPLLIGKFAFDASARLTRQTREMKMLSERDRLTGLLNRPTFIERLDELLRGDSGRDSVIGVLFIDLDNFKTINDSLGHRAGDRVLVRLSSRLSKIGEQGGLIGRYGGDEFVAAVHAASTDALASIATRLIDDLSRDVSIDGTRLKFGATVGISVFSVHAHDAATLISTADVAMYEAKKAGKGTFSFYDAQLAEAAAVKYRIARRLRAAIQTDLQVYYQPQVELATGRMAGVEALARWRDEELGEVSPAVFIPIAEEMGLITELGVTVLRRACSDAARWRDRYGAHIPVSVNVSALQLRRPEFVDCVRQMIERFSLDASLLELEVTESALLDKMGEARGIFRELENLGVRIAVDDFGTGYSNLSYLHALKVDRLKIDQSFIRALHSTSTSQPIVSAVIAMAHAMGIDVVAEGVETGEQARWLRTHGCALGQGYFYSRAITPAAIEQLLLDAGSEPLCLVSAEEPVVSLRALA
jgi:diguanylate cyclase (GGDEF)-like protein